MIERRRPQMNFAEGLIAEEVGPLWEAWMRHVDQVLEDEQLLEIVHEALAQRCPLSRSRGRPGTPAEVVVRMLLLKHIRNWSYATLEREVRANLVYRQFTRVGAGKVPDAKTLGRLLDDRDHVFEVGLLGREAHLRHDVAGMFDPSGDFASEALGLTHDARRVVQQLAVAHFHALLACAAAAAARVGNPTRARRQRLRRARHAGRTER